MKSLFLTAIMGTLLLFMSTGCITSQSKLVSQNAGLVAAVTWVSYDNPSAEEVAPIKEVVTVIKEVSVDTANGETYTEAVFPVVQNYVEKAVENGNINANEAPLVKAGSLALLNGIDLLFATYPNWAKNHELARSIVSSFLLGAETGLSLADDDPRMVNARQANATRARVFKE